MASIRKLPSGRFNVQIRRKNAKPLSASFPTLEEAERQEDQLAALPTTGPVSEPPLSFLALGRRYCDTVLKGRPSRAITLSRVERIVPHLPDDVRTMTKFDVNGYRLMRLDQVAPATCREELQIIHRIFRWAHSELLLDKARYPS